MATQPSGWLGDSSAGPIWPGAEPVPSGPAGAITSVSALHGTIPGPVPLSGTIASTSSAHGVLGRRASLAGSINPPSHGAQFVGANSEYVVGNTAFADPQVFTIRGWFRTSSVNGGGLFGFGSSPPNSYSYDRMVWLDDSGIMHFGCYNGSTTEVSSTAAYNDNKWHYFAATLSSAGMVLYVDGVLVAGDTNTVAQSYTGYWAAGYVTTNAWPNGPSDDYLDGEMYGVVYYDVALTFAEVMSDYNHPTTVQPGAVQWWTLATVNGTTVPDASGNGNTGTAHGSIAFGTAPIVINSMLVASLSVRRPLPTGQCVSTSALSGHLGVHHPLTGAIDSTSTCAGTLRLLTISQLSGASTSAGDLSGTLRVLIAPPLRGVIASTSIIGSAVLGQLIAGDIHAGPGEVGYFNGSSYFTTTANLSGGGITAAVLFARSASQSGNPRLVSNDHTDADSHGFELFLNQGDQPTWSVGNGGSNATISSPTNITDENWHLFVGTWNNVDSYLYIDGSEVVSGTLSGTLALGSNGVEVGQGVYGSDQFTGMLAYAVVIARPLTAAEVSTLYTLWQTENVNSFLSALLSYGPLGVWPLNGNLNDASGNGYTGTNDGVTFTAAGVFVTPNSGLAAALSVSPYQLLTGDITSTSALTGSIKQPAVTLAGAVHSTSALTGALGVQEHLGGAVRSVSRVTGALAIATPLAGAVASSSALTGRLTTSAALGGNIDSRSTVAGVLGVRARLQGPIASVSTLRGVTTGPIPLRGAAVATSRLAGTVRVSRPLAGALASSSLVTGLLAVGAGLGGSIVSRSTTTGRLGIGLVLAGGVTSTSSAHGVLGVGARCTGTVGSVSHLTARLGVGIPLRAGIASQSTISGSVGIGPDHLQGHLLSTSTLQGGLFHSTGLIGPIRSASALAGKIVTNQSGTIASTSSLSGQLLAPQFPAAFGGGWAMAPYISVQAPPPPSADDPGYGYLSRTRSARAIATVTVPITPPPAAGPPPGPGSPPITAGITLSPIWQVSEQYPAPTVIAGIPYGSATREPWLPSKVTRELWANQLQIVVGGQDVTYFRNLPTIVQSWTSQEPFGDAAAVIQFPGVTSFDGVPQPPSLPTGNVVGIAGTYTGEGYWQAAAAGLVTAYGDGAFYGDPLGLLNAPVSGIAAHPSAYGYVLCGQDGGVFAFGAVPYENSLPGLGVTPSAPIVGIATSATGNGYWLVGADGSVYAFGDATYYGNADVSWPTYAATGIARSPGGAGYLICASNGGVFAFGDATYDGGGTGSYVAPFVGIATTPSVNGYWLVNTLGEVYAYGSATYEGGVIGPLDAPANSISATPNGAGYWLSAQDGGVFAYGNAPFLGSVPSGGLTTSGSLSWLRLGAPVTIYSVLFLSPPTDLTVTPKGTAGTTTWSYAVTATTKRGETVASQPASTDTGNATLSTTNYNALAWEAVTGATGYNVYRYIPAQSDYQLIGTTTTLAFDDSGQTASAQTPPTTNGAATTTTLFEGVVADWEDAVSGTSQSVGMTVQCVGCLFQLDWYIAKPTVNLPFVGYNALSGQPIFGWDIGDAIAQAINSAIQDPSAGTAIGIGPLPTYKDKGSPISAHLCAPVKTGVLTVTVGTWNQLLSGFITAVLANAQAYGGMQYTVALQRPRTPILVPKNFDTVNWTVSTGGRGVTHSLSLDLTTAANAIYGQGDTPPVISPLRSGNPLVGQWQNMQYPRVYGSSTPAFPLGAGKAFTPGGAETGFSPFSSWMVISGWPLTSQDQYVATDPGSGVLDQFLIQAFQQQAGLDVSGNVDERTWNAAFETGENAYNINNVWYSPLWQLPEVEPFAYSANGSPVGLNPAYNPQVPRVERYEQMGQMLTKGQGVLSAVIEGERLQVPAWTGTITLAADPEEGSRFDIVAGQNIQLQYFHGRSELFHISAVSVNFVDLTVDLTVASQPLDLQTLAALWSRDAQAQGIERTARPSLANLNVSSATTVFDSESGAGILPPTAVPAEGWVVVQVPFESFGSVTYTELVSDPPVPFAFGVFSGPVTPSELVGVFTTGGPLATTGGGNPWNTWAIEGENGGPGTDQLGLLYGAGGPSLPCGYYPGNQFLPQYLTGMYQDGSQWEFAPAPGYSPWLWVAIYADFATTISGRFYPSPEV